MVLMNHALWQMTVKALLFQDDGRVLALTTPDGYLDFPANRHCRRFVPRKQARNVAIERGGNRAGRVAVAEAVH